MRAESLKKYVKSCAIALLVVLCGTPVDGQTLPSLLLSQDPSAVAMGMTGVASEASAYAIQNNVAAIPLSDNTFDTQVGLGLWQPSYADLKTIGAGGIYRFEKLGLGVDIKTLLMQKYNGVSGAGSVIRDSEFAPREIVLAAGFSYAFLDFLSAGVSLRYAGSKLASEASASVFGADIALYFYKNDIRAGLSVNNIGTKVKYSETACSQPMLAKLGAGYELQLGTSSLGFLAEVDILFAGGMMAGAGCEYSFKNIVFARAGYHYGDSANAVPSYVSAGVGLKLFGAQLNVAYLFASPVLANTLSLSLGYTF